MIKETGRFLYFYSGDCLTKVDNSQDWLLPAAQSSCIGARKADGWFVRICFLGNILAPDQRMWKFWKCSPMCWSRAPRWLLRLQQSSLPETSRAVLLHTMSLELEITVLFANYNNGKHNFPTVTDCLNTCLSRKTSCVLWMKWTNSEHFYNWIFLLITQIRQI